MDFVGRKDPFTRETFIEADAPRVVQCANDACGQYYFEDSWKVLSHCQFCHSTEYRHIVQTQSSRSESSPIYPAYVPVSQPPIYHNTKNRRLARRNLAFIMGVLVVLAVGGIIASSQSAVDQQEQTVSTQITFSTEIISITDPAIISGISTQDQIDSTIIIFPTDSPEAIQATSTPPSSMDLSLLTPTFTLTSTAFPTSTPTSTTVPTNTHTNSDENAHISSYKNVHTNKDEYAHNSTITDTNNSRYHG